MNIVQKLVNYFKAGYPCLAIQTTEEKRIQSDIYNAAKQIGRSVATWSASEGIIVLSGDTTPLYVERIKETEDLRPALEHFLKSDGIENQIIILRDIHNWSLDRDPYLSRFLRDVITDAPSKACSVVIIAPDFQPYSSIAKLVTMVDYALPSYEELQEIAKNTAEGTTSKKKIKKASDEAIRALSGLSTTEAENACALSLVEKGEFCPDVIYREKVAAVKRTDLLEIVDPDPRGLDAIGGLENLKAWILTRKKSYSPEAEKYGLPSPKGVLLVGIPGSGKSLSAKVIGTALNVPTLRLDMGKLFSEFVGKSEQRTREALQLAEAMSPCLLFVDEVEKGLAGAGGSGSNDSGVTRRVFGTILQWMQDKKKPVFCCFTANQVDSIPPEFLRCGRFDALFTLDLPHQQEREQISAVVIRKLGRDPSKFDLTRIAQATQDYTGAEIEGTITESLYIGFDDNERPITTDDVVQAAKTVIPISKTMAEKIETIRKWGNGRARQASIPAQISTVTSNRKLKV